MGEHDIAPAHPWNPRVTALVPTYNGAQFIQRTLDSLAAQTWTNLEILIGDDCSTDDTLQIVRRFANEHPDTRVLERDANLGWLRNSNDLMARAARRVDVLRIPRRHRRADLHRGACPRPRGKRASGARLQRHDRPRSRRIGERLHVFERTGGRYRSCRKSASDGRQERRPGGCRTADSSARRRSPRSAESTRTSRASTPRTGRGCSACRSSASSCAFRRCCATSSTRAAVCPSDGRMTRLSCSRCSERESPRSGTAL